MNHRTFYGASTTLWQSHLFKVYVAKDALHFARIADRPLAERGIGKPKLVYGLGGIFINEAVYKPSMRKRAEMEAKLDKVEPGSAEFLALDKNNFSLKLEELSTFSLNCDIMAKERDRGGIGCIQYTLRDERTGKFDIYGELTSEQLAKSIKKLIPNAEITM